VETFRRKPVIRNLWHKKRQSFPKTFIGALRHSVSARLSTLIERKFSTSKGDKFIFLEETSFLPSRKTYYTDETVKMRNIMLYIKCI